MIPYTASTGCFSSASTAEVTASVGAPSHREKLPGIGEVSVEYDDIISSYYPKNLGNTWKSLVTDVEAES